MVDEEIFLFLPLTDGDSDDLVEAIMSCQLWSSRASDVVNLPQPTRLGDQNVFGVEHDVLP